MATEHLRPRDPATVAARRLREVFGGSGGFVEAVDHAIERFNAAGTRAERLDAERREQDEELERVRALCRDLERRLSVVEGTAEARDVALKRAIEAIQPGASADPRLPEVKAPELAEWAAQRIGRLTASLEEVRALGEQAREAANERRRELEDVMRAVSPTAAAYEPGRALELVQWLRGRFNEEATRGFEVNPFSVTIPRQYAEDLVNALDDAWWVKAARALSALSDALIVDAEVAES